MLIVRCVIFLLIVLIIPSESLKCYECGCDTSDLPACNCGEISDLDDDSYCAIFETRGTDISYIDVTRIARDATAVYLEDSYFILVQESIRYNQSSTDWYLTTTGVAFGCDWDLCNAPNLIDILPNSFKLTVDKTWLDTNIYGAGSVAGCHHCPVETCGNRTNPIEIAQCPITACANGINSCLAYDFWNDIATGEQCYQSDCAPAYLNDPDAEKYGGKYRLDIEAIVYLETDRSKFDIWELDVYCAGVGCSRPSIFDEIKQQLSGNIGDLSGFPIVRPIVTQPPPTTSTPIANPLRCYACECFGTTTCPCATTEVSVMGYTYCVIVRENYGQNIFIYSGHIDYSDTYIFIQELPFALVEESINYNEGTGRWFTTTNFVIYGCNWDLCNKADLVPLLPDSFQMRLPEAWLNTSVLGTGQPVRNCHECPFEPQCGTTDFLNNDVCPIQACNTTCLVLDTYDDPDYDYLCYQSYCLGPDTEFFQYDQHRVEIEGVVYASEQSVVQLWEIDIFCRADDCSRPGIFKELREQLRVQPGTLTALFNETHDPNIPQRRCYDCYCYSDVDCNCDRTTVMRADSTYCTIVRENFGQDVFIAFEHIDQDSTRVHIREFPYLLVEESIIYNERTGQWNTITNLAVYGCDWDYCNHPRFFPFIPSGFQMRLPEAWLNTSVLGTGQAVRDCHECPDAVQCGPTDFLDVARCPIRSCNTTCLVFDSFDDPANDLQCYQSFCAPPDTTDFQIDSHRVELEGILYLNKPSLEVELWEVDVYCRADDCSRPEIFKEIRSELTVQLGDLSIFLDQTTPQPETTTSTGTMSAAMNVLSISVLTIIITHLR